MADSDEIDGALRESETKYRTLFENMAQGVFLQRSDGRLVDVNPAALEIFGLNRDQFLGRTSLDPHWRVITEEGTDLPGDRHPSIVALKTGKPVRNRVVGVYNNRIGAFRWVTANAIPLFVPGEEAPREVFVTLHDITSRKLVEKVVASRLHLMQFADSHTMDELLQETLDEVGTLTDSPIGFYHFLESDQKTLSLQAWSTRTLREMCTAEGKGRHYKIDDAGVWADCVRKRRPVIHNDYATLPHRKGMPEGHARVVRELAVPVFREGRIVAILGVGNKPADYAEEDVRLVMRFADLAWDVASRKQAEERHRESEERFRAIANYTVDWEMWVGPDRRPRWINPAVERMTGYSCDECMAMEDYPLPLIAEADRAMITDRLREASEGTRGANLEFRILRKDGTERWGAVSWQPIFDADGCFLGHRSSVRDITDRKREEAERESLILQLQKALAEVRVLRGILPICASCKKVRDDKGYWKQIEAYIRDHSEATFSHGICPECAKKLYPDVADDEK
jgi:PAS domain S-box-containing protein